MTKKDPQYLAIPMIALRRLVELNKNKPDAWYQLFEIDPARIFTKSELESFGKLESNGTIVVDLNKIQEEDND